MKIRRMMMPAMLSLTMCLSTVSCEDYNYTDQLQSLGARVEILEKWAADYNANLNALQFLVQTVETQGYITEVVYNNDSTYTLLFNNGETITLRNGRQGKDGKDGKEIDFLVSVKQDTDGVWYWTLNGEWILDGDGHKLRAVPIDGKDGRDGSVGSQDRAIVPQVRINLDTNHWDISTDGGRTWTDTGVTANGKDGKDGKDGQDGADDFFMDIIESEDGQSITIVLSDGNTFVVPIVK